MQPGRLVTTAVGGVLPGRGSAGVLGRRAHRVIDDRSPPTGPERHPCAIRSRAERQADVRSRLQNEDTVWAATAGSDGTPHLVPVSLCWHGGEVLLATRGDRPLARDVESSGRARLGIGDGTDVVLIDAVASLYPWADADPSLTAAFVHRVQWDPGSQPGEWVLLRLIPERIRAWQSVEENLRGSLIMRDGQWLQ